MRRGGSRVASGAGNAIGAKGASALAAALTVNTTLRELHLGGAAPPPGGQRAGFRPFSWVPRFPMFFISRLELLSPARLTTSNKGAKSEDFIIVHLRLVFKFFEGVV